MVDTKRGFFSPPGKGRYIAPETGDTRSATFRLLEQIQGLASVVGKAHAFNAVNSSTAKTPVTSNNESALSTLTELAAKIEKIQLASKVEKIAEKPSLSKLDDESEPTYTSNLSNF